MDQPTPILPDTPTPPLTQSKAALRTIIALVLREVDASHGRSALGYLWAVLEPVGGIILMTFVFSLTFARPPIGASFPLFYASGLLPFLGYLDISSKVSQSLRFSRALLSYPGVTFLDAILARFLVVVMTQVMVTVTVLAAIFFLYHPDASVNLPAVMLSLTMMAALGLGIGSLNCFLIMRFPMWERVWAVLNRPLFLLSCVLFVFDRAPYHMREWLWWNPLVHIVGQMRLGLYPAYDGFYISPLYVFSFSGCLCAAALLLLRRFSREILER